MPLTFSARPWKVSPLYQSVFIVWCSCLTEAPQKKPYDVAYKVRSVQEIIDMQNKEVQKIQTLLEVPVSTLTGNVNRQAHVTGLDSGDTSTALRLEL